MSDEITRIPEGVAPVQPGKVENHWCEHPGCTQWGGLGFARFKTDIPRWYCFEHRADGEALL